MILTEEEADFLKFLDKIIKGIQWICMFLLIEMVAVIFFQVVSRYCFDIAHFWAEELAVFSMIWLVFLGSVIAESRCDHTRITFFVNLLPVKLRAYVNSFSDLLCIIFLTVLTVKSSSVITIAMRNISTGVRIPMGFVYLSLPIGGILMILYFLADIYKNTLIHKKEGTP